MRKPKYPVGSDEWKKYDLEIRISVKICLAGLVVCAFFLIMHQFFVSPLILKIVYGSGIVSALSALNAGAEYHELHDNSDGT
jgi:hypothetical protein